ncbi:lanthionine synthetase C family protein [Aliikangiella maris]|uniref:LanC-like protein n=2 Tax=Aliikangiella maris TaxID=3162458 RepID=A0ABV2BYZ1_9GAMM
MLYLPERHHHFENELQYSVAWDNAAARHFIETLQAFTEQRFTQPNGWVISDDPCLENSFYDGTAGIIWSQYYLAHWGYGELKHNYQAYLAQARVVHRERLSRLMTSPDYQHGLLIGELGLIVAECRLGLTDNLRGEMSQIIEKLIHNPVCELMWGAPGALCVANFYRHQFPEFLDLTRALALQLEEDITTVERFQLKVWYQQLYGHYVAHLGAVHGFAGNAFSILKALPALQTVTANNWKAAIIDTVSRTALVQDSFANWPQSIAGERPGRTALLLQFCHGAPGLIACLSNLFGEDQFFDQLMIAGGELVWQAGPLKKGQGLCHGNTGNGFSLLKLFQATGDELWLYRARQFAAFAMQQIFPKLNAGKKLDLSLWNGAAGLAHFVHHCLQHSADIPTMDYF